MRILFYGECDYYGTGAWCYYETCKDLGIETDFFNPSTFLEFYKNNLFYKVIRKINNGYLKNHKNKHIQSLHNKVLAFKPDIVVILKGLLIDKNAVEKIKSNSFTVLINHDDFYSRFRSSRSNTLMHALSAYDHIFVTKKVNVDEIRKLNPNVSFFQFSYYPKIHRQPAYNKEDEQKWSSDIVFIGNSYPKRTRQLEYLVSSIAHRYNIRIFGGNWFVSKSSPLKKCITNKYLYPEDLQKAIFYAKITLCFLCEENRDDYTQRSFEIPACGGVLLAEDTEMHRMIYKDNKEAVFFNSESNEDLLEKVLGLLENGSFRNEVRDGGMQAVNKNEYTYAERIEEIINAYKKLKV